MNKIPFDLHTHSRYSFDGEDGAEEMINRAAALGLNYYALTDHIEVNQFFDPEYEIEKSAAEAATALPPLKEKYAGKLAFLYGVELGQPHHDLALAEKILAAAPYDFVIGSCHMLRGYEDFYFLDYRKDPPEKLLPLYFEEVLEMAETADFDVLGHLTYPLRYIAGDHGFAVDMKQYEAAIDEIFRTLIRRGKGIEINTSGYRQKIGKALPDLPYIKRYRALGGEILTIGSDAHNVADLGKNIPDGITLAKAAGFERIAIFKGRRAEFIAI
ncbi:MAG: histidinol-phosphatase HisJ family protein [Bacteroides sp.]|nr:histidinol-phosphatase HisJ family protein [Eubacterium sp.]MCM1417687.1 histidinol-phosphatase HisJ family protein [Roseburia sp.]MCM1461847.1 histidinol-phosphatase HisJ family protein [Bacteroides sp.]